MGHLETADILQDNSDPDWEEAFDRFQRVISSGIDESLQLKAIIKLAHVSKHAPHHILARAIPILAELLNNNVNEDSGFSVLPIHEAAVYCLKLMSCTNDAALATEVGKSGALDSILMLLSLQRSISVSFRMVLTECVWCLVNFSDENRVIVARNGGLDSVIEMLGWVEDGGRIYVLEILSALSLVREVRRVLVRSGGLRFLIEAGRLGSMVSRERACQAMGLIGIARRARPMLVELGAIPVLVELFHDGDGKAKLVAGNSLGVISAHVNFIRLVGQAGVIPLYAELLQGGEHIGKEIAEDVFCILAVDEENAVAIAEHLVRIMRVGDDDAKVAAADVLWDLSGYKHSVSVIRNSGAIPVLVELLRDGNDEVREKVSGAIAQLSYDEADRAALADAGVVPILIELLPEEELDELRDNAAEALVNFSEDPQQLEIISEATGLPSFQSMQNRLARLRVGEEHMFRSFRRMSIHQLTWDPALL